MTEQHAQRGVTLIEVLVALVLSVIGILGMIAMQMRAYAADAESYQRASAEILLQDMVSRINGNRSSAASYVQGDVGVGPVQSCAGTATLAAQDLCQWGNLLRGVAEQSHGNLVGAMTDARGCISSIDARTYIVSVVWAGVTPTGAPATACGLNAYGDERLRRAVTAIVRIADLEA
jgi:type IV pilus assembly protein PilV